MDQEIDDIDRVCAILSIKTFLAESLKIEGIIRDPTKEEIAATEEFLLLPVLQFRHVIKLQEVYAPDKPLRMHEGMNVRVGGYIPPEGGSFIRESLIGLIHRCNAAPHPWKIHVDFEMLHPFMDGNGRVGRTIWAWTMLASDNNPFALPFLHRFYYQTLANVERA